MGWIINEDGSKSYSIDLKGKVTSKTPRDVTFSGNIRGVKIPIEFPRRKKYNLKGFDLNCFFSAIGSNGEDNKQIAKELNRLYKKGNYAPYTHLVPLRIVEISKKEVIDGLHCGLTTSQLPCTATIREVVEFFPCYDQVLGIVLEKYEFPAFYISLLPDTIILNIKLNSNDYIKVPIQSINARCWDGVGHSHIHIVGNSENDAHCFRDILWKELDFVGLDNYMWQDGD